MGSVINDSFTDLVASTKEFNATKLEKIINTDFDINKRKQYLVQKSIELIALHSPVAGDLRNIIEILKASSDLERIADHIVNIANSFIELGNNKLPIKIHLLCVSLMDESYQFYTKTLIAIQENNLKFAYEIVKNWEKQPIVEEINKQVICSMKGEIITSEEAVELFNVIIHLEKIIDLIKNLSEGMIYKDSGIILD
ncbi:hypothetical protein MMJ62_04240 [Enterococcus cecorum]|uniref:phosphate signaling complex PhoU family protein n=3 Tax=Enterococcus cecorum TaxID=44008 RepID=UPI001FABBC54|nr:PhoU domain-containing protein [Enterococcus cecorum]MCJ0536884.1 hypothetical protein [Enterococcus cecorum]MCJ0550291.1 hypothetical protein [Enterococcus cecorum]